MTQAAPSTSRRPPSRTIVVVISLCTVCALGMAFMYRGRAVRASEARAAEASRCEQTRRHLQRMLARNHPKAGDIIRTDSVGYVQITNPKDFIQKTLIETGSWEPHIVERIQQLIQPGDTVVDVGAYIGTHTLPMAKAVGPEGHVHAFDPSAAAVTQLKRNLLLNSVANVTVHPKALGAERTEGLVGTVDMLNAGANIACTAGDIESGNRGCDELSKRGGAFVMTRLDDTGIRSIALMKIDVEGHELEVLRGGRKTLERDHPALIMEVWNDEHRPEAAQNKASVIALLAELGYRAEALDATNYLFVTEAAADARAASLQQ